MPTSQFPVRQNVTKAWQQKRIFRSPFSVSSVDGRIRCENASVDGDHFTRFQGAPPEFAPWLIGNLNTPVFETRTATGREHFACQDSGISQIFILIISNGEKILSNVNVIV